MTSAGFEPHDGGEQGEEESRQTSGSRQQDQSPNQDGNQSEELELVGQQQRQQEASEFSLHLELPPRLSLPSLVEF